MAGWRSWSATPYSRLRHSFMMGMMGLGVVGPIRDRRMKIALVFAADACASLALAPYRSERFIGALEAEGVTPIIVDVEGTDGGRLPVPAYAGAPTTFFCAADGLAHILRQERPALVQTFGAASCQARLWPRAGDTPVLHVVGSGGPVTRERDVAVAWRRVRPPLRSFAGWRARLASRHVDGLIGTNRADLGQHLDLGFFPRAAFSMVVPPPVEAAPRTDAGAGSTETPTFGVYDPGATAASLGFLLHAIGLSGQPDFFRVAIAPARLRALAPTAPAGVSFVDAETVAAFEREIDVLVLPYGEDRMTESVVAALRAGKIVIVPEGGAAAELIEYGRHGVLYAAGSAYHLAMAINVMAQSWRNRPFDFEGVEQMIAGLAPEAVARGFASAYRRLAA